jgi:hypothetical protein
MFTTDTVSVSRPLEGTGLLPGHYYDPYPARFAANAKELLAAGYPMVSRMHAGIRYPMADEDLFGRVDLEGHVTLLVGYDDDRGLLHYADPWPSNRPFGQTVDQTEDDGVGGAPVNATYDFACTGIPLPVAVTVIPLGGDQASVRAIVSLRMPNALTCGITDLRSVSISLALPEGIETMDEPTQQIGLISAGEDVTVEWTVQCVTATDGEIRVAAAGIGHGVEPYQWEDIIGGQAALKVTATTSSAAPALLG